MNGERVANIALAGLTLAPLVMKETMSKAHAMRFPLVGSAMLLSLFLLFKFLSKDLVNAVLTSYFFVLGILALSATLLPAIRQFLPTKWNEDVISWRFPYFRSYAPLDVEFTRSQVVAAIPGTFFCVWYVAEKHWLANNILGLAFCIQGIEMLSLGSFKTLEVQTSATLLPAIRRFLPTKWNEDVISWHFPYFRSYAPLDVEFTRSQVVAAIPGTFFCVWYVAEKHWLANNILGLAFCIQV
nr:signal peptide peptidase [Tanacetum cinerariifolium]